MGTENLRNPKPENPSSYLIIKNPIDSNLGIYNNRDKVFISAGKAAGVVGIAALVLFAAKYTPPLFEKNVPPASPLSKSQVEGVLQDLADLQKRQEDELKVQENAKLSNVKKVVGEKKWGEDTAN